MQEDADNTGQVIFYSPNLLNWCLLFPYNLYSAAYSIPTIVLKCLWSGEESPYITDIPTKFVGGEKNISYHSLTGNVTLILETTISESRKQPHSIYSAVTNGTCWEAASFKLTQPSKGIPTTKGLSVSKDSCWRQQHGPHLKANWMLPLYCIRLIPQQAAFPRALWLTGNPALNLF